MQSQARFPKQPPLLEGPKIADSLPKAKSVRLLLLLTNHSIHAEYDGFVMSFDSVQGIRKLVPGERSPKKPTIAEIMRFEQDVQNAAKNDYAMEAFMKANPIKIRDVLRASEAYNEIWNQAIDRDPSSMVFRFFRSPMTPFRGKVPLNAAEPTAQPQLESKPGPIKVIELARSFAVEKDYGAYVIGYTHTCGFSKYNKATGYSLRANDAEIRVFQKDVKAALESKDAAVEAFVKDNPRLLK